MSKTPFSNFGGLIKWPQCVMVGDPITAEQAKEILWRTDLFFTGLGSNQREWDEAVWNEIGLPKMEYGENYDADKWCKYCEDWNKFREEHKFLELKYLSNDYISSFFVGGTHGWCHPDGTIHFWDNIGKWPSWEEVHEDCKKLAKAFPFLNIKLYLFNQESDCEEYYDYPKECVGGFKIKGGRVYCLKKSEYLDPHAPECSAPYGNEIKGSEDYINAQKKNIFGNKADLTVFRESRGEVFFSIGEFREYFSKFLKKEKLWDTKLTYIDAQKKR